VPKLNLKTAVEPEETAGTENKGLKDTNRLDKERADEASALPQSLMQPWRSHAFGNSSSPAASKFDYCSTRFFPDSAGKKRFAFGEQPFRKPTEELETQTLKTGTWEQKEGRSPRNTRKQKAEEDGVVKKGPGQNRGDLVDCWWEPKKGWPFHAD
jgi:hypothetical protein